MRPTRLELQGFASFRDRTELDFGDTDLFVFAGPTGAGKSTLLDAVCFSLYGSVPRYPSRNWVAPVVSQGLNEARVRLTFDLEGTTYAATRVVRRTASGASTKEARLERLADGQVAETLAGSAAEVTEQVEALLGLSFEHFVKTVVLPQGAFQDFMHARPSERQDLLVELLGLDVYRRVASAARARARDAEQTAELTESRLQGRLAEVTEDTLAAAEDRVAALEKLSRRVAEARPRLDELREEGGRLTEVARTARDRAARLDELTAPEGVEELSRRRGDAQAAVQQARERVEEAEQAREAAEQARAALPDAALLARVRDLVDRRDTLASDHESAQQRLDAAERTAEQAAQRLEEAAGATAEAREALQAARRTDLAATLAEGLAAGDDCPVCRRPLTDAPDHDRAGDLEGAREAVEEARRGEEDARGAAREAGEAVAAARRERDNLAEQLEEVSARLDDAADRLAAAADTSGDVTEDMTGDVTGDTTGDVTAPEVLDALDERLEQAGERVREAAGRAREARAARRRAEAALAEVREDHEDAWAAFDETRDALGDLQPPPVDRDDLAGSWTALVGWADERRPALREEADEAEAAVEETREAYRQLREELVAACEEHDVPVGDRSPGEAVAAALERARNDARTVADQLEQATELRDELQASREKARVARELGQHLAAPRFERWLLNRALRHLVVGATEVMQSLSDGAYSLALDDSNQFEVIDHRNADQTRSARTLSGGETFLASLSLALALSEHVAELAAGSSARLEALFLDEGFGALDADTLDTVAAAIETLGSRGRMVGLITHVRDLAERIPVRFEVSKTAGGSSIERVVS